MKILLGKTKDQILIEFMQKLKITDVETFYKLIRYIESRKIHITFKNIMLLWAIPLFLSGFTLTIVLVMSLVDKNFPWVIDNFDTFLATYVNVMQACVTFFAGISMMLFSVVKMVNKYDI